MHNEYERRVFRRILTGTVLSGITLLVFTLSVGYGSISINLADATKALFGLSSDETINHVIGDIRLPRAVGAALAGASLALAGLIMQNILKNPLASPFTIGVSQGAAFGAAFAIIVLKAGQAHTVGNEFVTLQSPYIIIISAFAGSLISLAFILIASSLRNATSQSVILAGVAISAFFGASTMFIQYFATDVQVAASVFWTFGDLSKSGWMEIGFLAPVFCSAFLYFFYHSWNLNALQWGDESAQGLGVRVKMMRITGLIVTSFLVAVVTAFLGIIGFIGLITPHIVRMLIGADYRFLIPITSISGALILLLSDLISRFLLAPVVLPVGIITSFAGAPVFLYLLFRNKQV